MREVVLVSGTDTGVGKTWVAAHVLKALAQRGVRVSARKPVQSFDPHEGPTDADILAAASAESPQTVCPEHRRYGLPLAPPIAAEVLGRPPIRLHEVLEEIDVRDGALTLVEGVGGARSPLADDGDCVSLAEALSPDVVILVVPAGLGAISAVRLGVSAFVPLPVVVYMNRFDAGNESHVRNLVWLTEVDHFEVCASIPELVGALGARFAIDVATDPTTSAAMEV